MNKYIIGFIDHFFRISEETIPRHSVSLQIMGDNESEYVNRVIKETYGALTIMHVTISLYYPQSNGRIERFNKTLSDILSKLMKDDTKT